MRLSCACALLLLPFLSAADRKVEPAKTGDETVDISGVALTGREQVKPVLGMDPGVEMIIVELKLKPKADKSVTISRDDFTLISRKDGQKSLAMHPSQVAGSATLMVESREAGASGGFGSPRRGPIWGGMPGTGTRPRRMGGDNDVSAVNEGETRATVAGADAEENPVVATLKQKELRQITTAEPVSGLLYFVLEGKHKLKDLELLYKTSESRLTLDFQK